MDRAHERMDSWLRDDGSRMATPIDGTLDTPFGPRFADDLKTILNSECRCHLRLPAGADVDVITPLSDGRWLVDIDDVLLLWDRPSSPPIARRAGDEPVTE